MFHESTSIYWSPRTGHMTMSCHLPLIPPIQQGSWFNLSLSRVIAIYGTLHTNFLKQRQAKLINANLLAVGLGVRLMSRLLQTERSKGLHLVNRHIFHLNHCVTSFFSNIVMPGFEISCSVLHACNRNTIWILIISIYRNGQTRWEIDTNHNIPDSW